MRYIVDMWYYYSGHMAYSGCMSYSGMWYIVDVWYNYSGHMVYSGYIISHDHVAYRQEEKKHTLLAGQGVGRAHVTRKG